MIFIYTIQTETPFDPFFHAIERFKNKKQKTKNKKSATLNLNVLVCCLLLFIIIIIISFQLFFSSAVLLEK